MPSLTHKTVTFTKSGDVVIGYLHMHRLPLKLYLKQNNNTLHCSLLCAAINNSILVRHLKL